jgi:hypothetical protein
MVGKGPPRGFLGIDAITSPLPSDHGVAIAVLVHWDRISSIAADVSEEKRLT